MACWDIIGKDVNKPVYDLLGGKVHEKLRSYTYLYPGDGEEEATFFADPDRSAQRAAEYVEQGFTAIKFDPAGKYTILDPHQPSLDDIALSVEFVRKIREAVGTRADLLFGTHGQFTTAGAIRLARQLEPFDPLWFEEPTPPENPREMARVARQTTIPIATGERLTTKYEFARVLENQAASILQMALGRVGGILEAKKIAGMAETYYAQIAPHLYCGPIEGAANIQISALKVSNSGTVSMLISSSNLSPGRMVMLSRPQNRVWVWNWTKMLRWPIPMRAINCTSKCMKRLISEHTWTR
jgi:2-dehydro-3-deoxyphosphogalactonate aldolase